MDPSAEGLVFAEQHSQPGYDFFSFGKAPALLPAAENEGPASDDVKNAS